MNQELHIKSAEDTHSMTDDRMDVLQKKTGGLDTELSKMEKLRAEKDALNQQLQAFATEREKLISDNAYLDNLVEYDQKRVLQNCDLVVKSILAIRYMWPGQTNLARHPGVNDTYALNITGVFARTLPSALKRYLGTRHLLFML
ncbi:hypothetical protein PHET_05246 [Paragonimus heterotremus]|uniref:Uncharacterized protein n=1 Tax=Paragonimus heterotremus TaxID=100268 RepID=A0A8J4WGZ3_9TREM|nr:hypothetical protein PHET_05246 [Paragonimus heterotremus]